MKRWCSNSCVNLQTRDKWKLDRRFRSETALMVRLQQNLSGPARSSTGLGPGLHPSRPVES